MSDCNQKWKVCQLIWLAQLLALVLVFFLISSSEGSKGKQWSFHKIAAYNVSASESSPVQINLGHYKYHSLTIPLREGSISQKTSETGGQYIEFEVIPPSEVYGIIAVIQTLNLRGDEESTPTSTCQDYIQFATTSRYPAGSLNQTESAPTCGSVSRSDKTASPPSLVGQRAFLSPTNSTLKVRLVTAEGADETAVEVTFTAYASCPGDREKYGVKACVNLVSVSTCISEHVFCDKNLNCMVDKNFVGDDEDICNINGFWHWVFGYKSF